MPFIVSVTSIVILAIPVTGSRVIVPDPEKVLVIGLEPAVIV